MKRFQKRFLRFVSEDSASWKKARNIHIHMLEFTFSRKDVINQKAVWWAGKKVVIERGMWNI